GMLILISMLSQRRPGIRFALGRSNRSDEDAGTRIPACMGALQQIVAGIRARVGKAVVQTYQPPPGGSDQGRAETSLFKDDPGRIGTRAELRNRTQVGLAWNRHRGLAPDQPVAIVNAEPFAAGPQSVLRVIAAVYIALQFSTPGQPAVGIEEE